MSLHFSTFPVHFFRPPFFGLIHWFRAKTTWENHPNGFLSPKKAILAFSKKISEKSWIFGEKPKKKFLLILFVFKCPKTHFRHNLQLFLPYKSIKRGKTGQIWHFLRFLVIFGDFHCGPKKRCRIAPKCPFDPGI